MQLVWLRSKEELLSAAGAYNDLWRRSEVALPAARAEALAAWLDHFAARRPFELLVAVDAGRWAAALPLVGRRLNGFLPAACLPFSPWWTSGELLLDPEADQDAALDQLLSGFAGLKRPLVWLDAVRFTAPRWQALIAAADRAKLPCSIQGQGAIGQIQIEHDWEDYRARWSKGHRRKLQGAGRKVEAAGGVQLRLYDRLTPAEVEPLVRAGFEVEHRSWKGAAGTSVLSQPGMLEYFCEQGRRLAAAGCLELAFLEHRGTPIAFEFGLAAKGVYYSYKVGYDARFAELTPGQMLRYKLLERFHADPNRTLFDFAGPLAEATAKWSTRAEPVGRLVIGGPTLAGRLLGQAYSGWSRRRATLHSRGPQTAVLQVGVRPHAPICSGRPV